MFSFLLNVAFFIFWSMFLRISDNAPISGNNFEVLGIPAWGSVPARGSVWKEWSGSRICLKRVRICLKRVIRQNSVNISSKNDWFGQNASDILQESSEIANVLSNIWCKNLAMLNFERSGVNVCRSCRSRQELSNPFPTNIYLQKSASVQPRTSPSKFGGKIQFNIHFTP